MIIVKFKGKFYFESDKEHDLKYSDRIETCMGFKKSCIWEYYYTEMGPIVTREFIGRTMDRVLLPINTILST